MPSVKPFFTRRLTTWDSVMSKARGISSCCTSNNQGRISPSTSEGRGHRRPIGGYGYPNAVRVTIGTQQENEKFIEALGVVIGTS